VDTVQLALTNRDREKVLREALLRSGSWRVVSVPNPDPFRRGVTVMDEETFGKMRRPLAFPERVVLFARRDPQVLTRAWEAGIRSVVYDEDPSETAVLAIMAAALRSGDGRQAPGWVLSPSGPLASGPGATHLRSKAGKGL
jgi:hypothetical protein